MTNRIAIVVPTIREESYREFLEAWNPIIESAKAKLLAVVDGDVPVLNGGHTPGMTAREIMGDADADLIFNRTDACRNLGFAYIAKYLPEVEVIITLDDDVRPENGNYENPIFGHIRVLGDYVPTSWISSVGWGIPFMRGFPYSTRQESKVLVSHGVWTDVPDLDAATQIQRPDCASFFEGPYYKGPVPRGIFMPFCGMNVGFLRAALPMMYYAPMGPRAGYHRWADILLGMSLTRELEHKNAAMFTGASVVRHIRASDANKNLELERDSIRLGEAYFRGEYDYIKDADYVADYEIAKRRWARWIRNNQS